MSFSKQEEKYAELIFNIVLKEVVIPLTGNNTTYMTTLNEVGKKLLGSKFKGVFPSDNIPVLTDKTPYAILNLDSSDEAGSHWISIAKHNNNTYVYDSFGRRNTQIIPNLEYSGNGKIIDTDRDSEQKITESNCGARALAFLIFYDKWGSELAKLI